VKSRILYLSIIILGLIASFSLARSLYNTYQNSNILVQSEEQLQKLQQQNSDLKKQEADASSPDYVSRVARDKLGLVKPGEVVVILPPQVAGTATTSSEPQQKSDSPVWKRWWKLLFGG